MPNRNPNTSARIPRVDDDSDSEESMHETFPPGIPTGLSSPLSPRNMKSPRRSHTMKRLSPQKLLHSPKRSNSGRSRNADQIKFSLFSVTWQNRVAGGDWEYYSPENSNVLTAAYRHGSVGLCTLPIAYHPTMPAREWIHSSTR